MAPLLDGEFKIFASYTFNISFFEKQKPST